MTFSAKRTNCPSGMVCGAARKENPAGQTFPGAITMDSKYNRSVTLQCPTCGGKDFATGEDAPEVKTCAGCNRQFSKDELIRENQASIQANLDDLKKQVTADLTKNLRDALKKLK